MNLPRPWRLGALLLVIATAGCHLLDAPVEEDDTDDPFVHRANTTSFVIPAVDGGRVLLVLEARRVDAISHGVMISGWRGKVAGDAVARVVAGDDAGRVVTTIPGGRHWVDYDDEAAYVFTSALREWPLEVPFDPAPTATDFGGATIFDRATLAPIRTVAFDPPLAQPMAWGGGKVLDGPRDGASDVARDASLTIVDVATGARSPLYRGRGFAAFRARCGDALALAHRAEDAARGTTIVFARGATARSVDVPDLRPTAVVCRRAGNRVAVVGTRDDGKTPRLVVIEAAGETPLTIARDVAATQPATLSVDGQILLASHDGHAALYMEDGKVQELVAVAAAGSASTSADRALVNGADAGWIVRLDGAPSPVVPVDRATTREAKRSGESLGGGRFVFFDTDDSRDEAALLRGFLLDDAGHVDDLTTNDLGAYPTVIAIDANRALLVASRLPDKTSVAVDVFSLDLKTRAITRGLKDAFCDWHSIRRSDRCLP